MESYKTLEKIFRKLNDINQASSSLQWDMAVTMPSGGAEARTAQIATLSSIHHAILSDEGVGDLLAQAKSNENKLNEWQKANLYEMGKTYNHSAAVPRKLVHELTKEGLNCEMVWRKAREANDFSMLKPNLEKVVKLVREKASIKAEAFEMTPYDALLDEYDRGRKSAQIDDIFDNLKGFLPDFIKAVVEKQASQPKIMELKGPFPIDQQKQLANKILESIGFNFKNGRLDESHHPFCGGYPGDVRITTRYDEENFLTAIMGVQHEAGHAMYEAGLPQKWRGQPVGDAHGMSIHESQSRLLEMQVCRSEEFMKFAAPLYKDAFGGKGRAWSADNLYRINTKVQPSLIRVDADEVTYSAHILMRYYMEKYLISGDMEVADIPDAWSQGMEKFLGIKPENDKDGCMQDIHWMDGTFGYFPTYTLGAIYAAQIFHTAKSADPAIINKISKGDFNPLMKWLGTNIHEQGSLYSADGLVEKATGKSLDVEIYKDHLKARYLGE
jgi:carboxypeptidase Taq